MKKKIQSYPLTQLMPHDFMLFNGKVGQLTEGFGFDVELEEAEDMKIIVAPIALTGEDMAIIKTKLKKNDKEFLFNYRAENGGFYVDLRKNFEGRQLGNYVSVFVEYYHELQHALRCTGCTAELNYHWAERERKKNGGDDNKGPEANG
jgi:hypothetical protein